MKLTSDKEILAESKVLILYALNQANKPLSNDALYSLVNAAVNMNYFYFQQFLLDLSASNYITSYENDAQKVIEITDSGKQTLNLTTDILPGIVKLKLDTNLKNNIEKFENEESISAEFTPRDNDEYEVNCKIFEKGEIVFEIKTLAYSQEQAQKIVDNWKNNASKLYPSLLSMLTKTEEN